MIKTNYDGAATVWRFFKTLLKLGIVTNLSYYESAKYSSYDMTEDNEEN